MKLATIRLAKRESAAVAVDDVLIPLPATDVAALLSCADWQDAVEAAVRDMAEPVLAAEADFAPAVAAPGKVICCGLNYGDHIAEMGRKFPEHPSLFAKYADTLTGAYDDLVVSGSGKVDWEAELAVVVGKRIYKASEDEAGLAIAGYTVANDVSMRDWQHRTSQWFQGKNFVRTTPLGPYVVMADEFGDSPDFTVRGWLNDELVQEGNTETLVFGPARILAYISSFTVLSPGDVVLTGTPGGVGAGMNPPRFAENGSILATEIKELGTLRNRVLLTA